MNNTQGIVFKTSSGQYYAYITATNQIITLDNQWYEQTVRDEKDVSIVFQQLEKIGINTHTVPERIEWQLSPEEYLSVIRHAIPALVLEITQECTLRCDYCIYSGNYQGRRMHSGKHMDWDTLKTTIDFYASHSLNLKKVRISFYGGEALIHFSLIKQAVDYIHTVFAEKEVIINISSNGTTLTESVVIWLQKNPDVSVTVTVNGWAHDKHRKLQNGQGSLKKIQENLMRIKQSYPDVWNRVDFLANAANYRELLEIRDYYSEHIKKPPALITGIIEEDGNDLIQKIVNTKEEKSITKQIEYLLYDEQDVYLLPNYQMELSEIASRLIGLRAPVCVETASCMPCSEKLFVSASGELGICESVGADNRLGNIYDGINIEWAEVLLNGARTIFNSQCRICWCQRLCSMCYTGMRVSQDGSIRLADGFCNRMRSNIEENLCIFCEVFERNPSVLQIFWNDK